MTEKAVVNLLFTHNWLKGIQTEALKPYGLSNQQFNILRILRGQHPQPASVKLLTERMLDKSSNASRLVDKLVQKGLVDRKFCENDRRQVDVLINEKGLKTIEAASKASEERLSDLKLSDKDFEQLSELLDKMRE